MAEEEEEVLIEVEAVQAVYGDDCVVLDSFPPNLHIHIKPRTADISSQQFVEAVIGMRASPQYPKEPPRIDLIESKGLDDNRQKHLITSVQDKAFELSSCLMLVALCEEAVEKLTVMNHPDGNCPLCLYPLVPEDEQNETLPFMKLMSCFHCFHSECIVRWWNWLQKEKESNASTSSSACLHPLRRMKNQNGMLGVTYGITSANISDMHGAMEESMGNCPVCRKVFHAKDFQHVLDLVGTHSSQLSSNGMDIINDENILQSTSEILRRQKLEAVLKLQQENSGLIETKKTIVVLPGMFLPQPVTSPAETVDKETSDEQGREPTVSIEKNSGGSSNRPSPTVLRNAGRRKQRVQNSRKQFRQWVRKENGSAK